MTGDLLNGNVSRSRNLQKDMLHLLTECDQIVETEKLSLRKYDPKIRKLV